MKMQFAQWVVRYTDHQFTDKILDLSNQNLQDCHLDEVITLLANSPTAIETLNLNNNKLTKLPAEFGQSFQALKNLFLNNNQISCIDDNAFSYIINSSRKTIPLLKLNLINNPLGTVPLTICTLTTLEELLLHDTRLKTLPTQKINNLTNLKRLGIKYNALTHLPKLCSLVHLTRLGFDGLVENLYETQFLLINTLATLSREPSEPLLKALFLLLESNIGQLKAKELEDINFSLLSNFLNKPQIKARYPIANMNKLFIENGLPIIWEDGKLKVIPFEKKILKWGSLLGITESNEYYGGLWVGENRNYCLNTWGGQVKEGLKWIAEELKKFIEILKRNNDSRLASFTSIQEAFQASITILDHADFDHKVSQYKQRIQEGKLTIIGAGWIGHAIGIGFLKTANEIFLLYCNKGSSITKNVFISRLAAGQEEIIDGLIGSCVRATSGDMIASWAILGPIDNTLKGKLVYTATLKAQKHGNCSVANVKSLVLPLLCLNYYVASAHPKNFLEHHAQSYSDYKEFTQAIRTRLINELIDHWKKPDAHVSAKNIIAKFSLLVALRAQNKLSNKVSSSRQASNQSLLIYKGIFDKKLENFEKIPLQKADAETRRCFINNYLKKLV